MGEVENCIPPTWGYTMKPGYTYDVEFANKLLAEAGYPARAHRKSPSTAGSKALQSLDLKVGVVMIMI
jgi:ABC-type transport system substrate-binding protein